MQIRILATPECVDILSSSRLGRLSCARDNQPYVVPIYFAFSDMMLHAFSMPGKKIEWMRTNPLVSVLFEARGEGQAWKCVVVDGHYEELPDRVGHKRARDHAWSLLSRHANWWEPGSVQPARPVVAAGDRDIFFRIVVDRLSGREGME